MLEFLIICITSFIASGLTLFSGFGLGTILLPVFGLFFPIELAIGLTAIVHFLNNCFKLILLGKHADIKIVWKFGLPAILFSFLGAYLLNSFIEMPAIYEYELFGKRIVITPVKAIVSLLLILFSLFELSSKYKKIQIHTKYLPVGGMLSGFFGGLSGHQGALRSAFLVKANLSKEAFIATGVLIACMIDVSRLAIYSQHIFVIKTENIFLVLSATASAFAGVLIANKFLKKITIRFVSLFVSIMLLIFSVLLGLGLI